MKIFVRASVATAVLFAATPSNAAFPSDVTALMDTTVDPCEDFFQYSCGNWVKNFTLPDDENYHYYSYTGLGKRNAAVIEDIVADDWPLVGELWDSCMALDKMTALGAKPLQKDLGRIMAVASKKDLAKLAGEFATGNDGPALLTISNVMADLHNTTNTVINTGSPTLMLPDRAYYLDNSTFASVEAPFRKYISTLATLASINANQGGQQGQHGGATSSDTKRVEDIVIKMETKLAEILPTDAESGTYYSLTYSEAATKYPLQFGAMTKGMGLQTKSTTTADTIVTFDSLPFMDRVEKFVASSDLSELKLYYSFVYAHTYADKLGEPFVAAKFAMFSTALQGTPTRPTRAKVCTDSLIAQFPDLIGRYYFLKAFDKNRQRSVEQLVAAIEKAMGEHLTALTWLDEPTRKQAEAKLAKVSNLLGASTQKESYPFVLSRDNYLTNIQTIQSNTWTRSLGKINKPVNKNEWFVSAATANSFYSWERNQMVFPAATLQFPFFSGDFHPVQNFAGIGSIIGHELTHGFDNDGRHFDGNGNQFNWWSDQSAKAFEERTQCMKDQYSKFVALGADGKPLGTVNGTLTITENVADNGGVSLAFDAYHEWAKSGPTFNSNGVLADEVDKLFFVSSSQVYCHKIRDELQKQWLITNVHAPGKWRVNGVLMNNDAFAKTYQCKAGSTMNPVNKCKVW